MQWLTMSSMNSLAGLLLVCGYYFVLWVRSGGYQQNSIVTVYSPPRDLSPAMLRFIWKERFDDRTFWACILSLVSKGVATLEEVNGTTYVRTTGIGQPNPSLSREESIVAKSLFGHRKRISLNITDTDTAVAVWRMSRYLHQKIAQMWFRSNYHYLLAGGAMSLVSVCIVASPKSPESWGVLLLGLATMAPGGYYGFFVMLRISDLLRAARKHIGKAVLGRAVILFGLLLPSFAAFILGGVVLGATFGVDLLVTTALLVIVNVVCLLRLRFPTAKGRKLLDEIAGFRDYLQSVERLPEDRMDAPGQHVSLYEKYLPYAVALEVEQSWCDRLVVLRSVLHEDEAEPGIRPFYLGMWDGSPVEIVYVPSQGRRL